ncbi:GDP-L-fucose synthase [bacterium]|nr:GDP-L-fucose synthase [bacterium]
MNLNSKIYIAGHRGMFGSALLRELRMQGYTNFVLRTSSELDLRNQAACESFFEQEKPEFVFLAAAQAGGIMANMTYRADFIYNNLQIQNNVIHSSWKYGVTKLLFLGSSCIYPKFAEQPMKEESLLTGDLEYSNEPYAIAKIAGLKMCESYNLQYGTNFISVQPTNLYGINDNFNLETSHVIPALMRRFHEAKEEKKQSVTLWGTGSPKREFLFIDDAARASIHLMQKSNFTDLFKKGEKEIKNTHINLGTGIDLTIKELAETVKKVVGFEGTIEWDTTKPDGTPRKLLDISKITQLGWHPEVSLTEGLQTVYHWYKKEFS